MVSLHQALEFAAVLLVLGAILPLSALVLDSIWALVAGTASAWLSRHRGDWRPSAEPPAW
jgi:hypothetical protein